MALAVVRDGIDCYIWHRLLLEMASTAANGIGCCLIEMASPVTYGIGFCWKWHRLLQFKMALAVVKDGIDCYIWHRLLLEITSTVTHGIGCCWK